MGWKSNRQKRGKLIYTRISMNSTVNCTGGSTPPIRRDSWLSPLHKTRKKPSQWRKAKGLPVKSGVQVGERRQEGIPKEQEELSKRQPCPRSWRWWRLRGKYTHTWKPWNCTVLTGQLIVRQLQLTPLFKTHCEFGHIFETLSSQLVENITCQIVLSTVSEQ